MNDADLIAGGGMLIYKLHVAKSTALNKHMPVMIGCDLLMHPRISIDYAIPKMIVQKVE